MKIKQLSLIICPSLLIASCGLLGPDYQRPKINEPTKWSSQDKSSRIESSSIKEMAWWKKFNDPKLNQLIESALSNNNNLQIAMGNLLQAEASLRQVNMGWVPMVNLGGLGFVGQSFNPEFTNNSGNSAINVNPANPQNFNGYGAGLMPSYTLNVFRQIKQGEVAELNLNLQKETVNAVRLGVISQVASTYFTLLGLKKQLTIQQELLDEAKEMRKYNLIQYQNGSISEFNLIGIDQLIANLTTRIPKIKTNITQSENALQVLTNNNPGVINNLRDFNAIKTNGIIPLNLPSTVLKSRPDIVTAEYQLQVANANIGVATSSFFPTINLTGMLGQGSIELSNLFTAGGDFWMAQLAAGMPIFNLSLYAQIDKAKANYYSAYYNYIQTVKNAFAEVDNGLANHNNFDDAAQAQAISLSKADELYQIAQKKYNQGSISYANTLGLKFNIINEKGNLNQLKIQQLNSIVNLYQVLGGGYLAESKLTSVKKFDDGHDI